MDHFKFVSVSEACVCLDNMHSSFGIAIQHVMELIVIILPLLLSAIHGMVSI